MAQYFTKEGLQKLKDELQELKTVKIPEITALIKYAREEGDLKENAGYHDARDRKSFMLGRIKQLEDAINDAVVIEKEDSSRVHIGCTVKILFGGKEETYHIVAPTESNILENKMSYQSPLGQQLINKKTGDEFDFVVKDNVKKVKVLKVT
jgi:transcription elongation factor GreA